MLSVPSMLCVGAHGLRPSARQPARQQLRSRKVLCLVGKRAAGGADKESAPVVATASPLAATPTNGVQAKRSSSTGVTMPPIPMKGMSADCSKMTMYELLTSDASFNAELSWLAFNWRVLAMAMDADTPIFERLRFLAITDRNLDEFFSKRVGALKRQEAAGMNNLLKQRGKLYWTPQQELAYIHQGVRDMVEAQANTLNHAILPELKRNGIHILSYADVTSEEEAALRTYFIDDVEPLITPLAVDPGHPFPFINSLTVSLAVVLRDPFSDDDAKQQFAIITVPASLQRWKPVASHGPNCFIPVEQIIVKNLDRLFGGMEIISVSVFRATRNADVERNEEEAEDLLDMMTDEVRERRFAPFVRLEVDSTMDPAMTQRLMEEFTLHQDDVYSTDGLLALGQVDRLPVNFGVDHSLEFKQWAPTTHPRLSGADDMFSVIRRGDMLVHHPFQSFANSTTHFFELAARDPSVVAIKATLYRTSSDSPIIRALVQAAENGKQVAVLVELKARFDEARNVGFAHKLEDAGCNVAYGLVGLKTHSKATLVVRQEEDGLRTYVHIGTGNYNPSTATVYTDFGLFSCNRDLGLDVADLFKYLTGYHRQLTYRKLLVAPNTMRKTFIEKLDREIANAKKGHRSGVVIKCNGLDDVTMVEKIYECSRAGVKVDIICRGICRVRPGVPGHSENVRAISVIGRFLEHHRIYAFLNAGEPEYFIGSADWMARNLIRRVEVVTPVEDHRLKKQLRGILSAVMRDTVNAWEMTADGNYQKPPRTGPFNYGLANEAWDAAEDDVDELGRRSAEIGFQATMQEVTLDEISKEKKRLTSHRAKPKATMKKPGVGSTSVHPSVVSSSSVKANVAADTPDTSGLN